MNYQAMTEMAVSNSLIDRVTACMAVAGSTTPREAAVANIMRLAATPGWSDVWSHATNEGYSINNNPDTGARNDVITDEMIRDGVDLLGLFRQQSPATAEQASGGVDLQVPDTTGLTEQAVAPTAGDASASDES